MLFVPFSLATTTQCFSTLALHLRYAAVDTIVHSQAMILRMSSEGILGYSTRSFILLMLVGVPAESHSWVEEAAVVDGHGQRIGPLGYARNNGTAMRSMSRIGI